MAFVFYMLGWQARIQLPGLMFKRMKSRATALLDCILNSMDSDVRRDMASRLRRGGYPADEECAYCFRVLGGAFLITLIDEARGLQAIHGDGPVCCEPGFTHSRDASGHSSGHYVLLRSWQPLPAILGPGSGGATGGARPPEARNRRLSSNLPQNKPAGKRGKANPCKGWNGVACRFSGTAPSTTAPSTPARQNSGTD